METSFSWPAEDEFVDGYLYVDNLAWLDATLEDRGLFTVGRENTGPAALGSNSWRFPTVKRVSSNVLRVGTDWKHVDFDLSANIMVDNEGKRRRSYCEGNRVTFEEVFVV